MDRWLVYLRERFPIATMSALVAGLSLSGIYLYGNQFSFLPFIISFVGLLAFFGLLRLMDEVKDIEKDRVAHRDRPLPRGLIKKEEALRLIDLSLYIFLAYGLIIWVVLEATAALTFVALTFYLWLMYKEFGLGKWLSARPVTYAITHQLVAFLIAFFVVSVAHPTKVLHFKTWAFGFMILGSFFCYEICRKLDPHAHPILATYVHFYGYRKTFELAVLVLVLSSFGAIELGLYWLLFPEGILLITLCMLFYQSSWYRLPEIIASLSLLLHVWAVFIQKVVV